MMYDILFSSKYTTVLTELVIGDRIVRLRAHRSRMLALESERTSSSSQRRSRHRLSTSVASSSLRTTTRPEHRVGSTSASDIYERLQNTNLQILHP